MVDAITAPIYEIFSGIQGEGILVGYRQIFLRLHGCSLGCNFCDTPASRGKIPAQCEIEQTAGARDMHMICNPLTTQQIIAAVQRLQLTYPHHSVSITGGEPLERAPFVAELVGELRNIGIPSYLETNGVCAEQLASLPLAPDFIAMDIKLPGTAGVIPCWERHRAFLRAARELLANELAARLQVKVVFAAGSAGEVAQAAALVAEFNADIPLVLQPVTYHHGAGLPPPTPELTLEAQQRASSHLHHVRVIPQTHVLLRQR